MQVFDPQKQTLLRQLKGHQRPVHTTRFALDKMHVLSGSDDATVSASRHLQRVPQAHSVRIKSPEASR